ncbi:MAG: hypothetical protein GTO02_21425 [Candidatus Dadabacteria bacterium]|nr:hypothetical protein [Candidatus Dadabacteria bacterium]
MQTMSTFPFGWIRNYNNDNWQIIWNKETYEIYLKGSEKKEFKKLGKCKNWIDAKNFADKIIDDNTLIEN